MRATFLLFFASLLLAAQGAADTASHCVVVSEGAPPLPARLMEGQGKIDFPITTSNPEARKFFEQGVAQMHSFWAREAERSFLQAAQLDPSAPMPWWGVAMVANGDYRPHFQLVRDKHLPGTLPSTANGKRALAAAKRAIELAAVPGKSTAMEKLFIDAIWARRNPDAADPDAGYVAGLRKIVAANPKDVESRTFLALHLMDGFNTPAREPRPGSMESVEILRQLAKEFPAHPGVHHYIIHGWEGSNFAKDAWESCQQYAALVPNIPHALHMPGHIYAQTGKLKEAQNSFTVAAALERKYMAEDKDYGNGHHGHNVHFLAVALSADGQFDAAITAAKELLTYAETDKEKKTPDAYRTAFRQGSFAMVRTLVWGEKWDEILTGSLLPELATPREKFWRHWARALAFSAKKDAAAATTELAAMRTVQLGFKDLVKVAPPREFDVALQDVQGFIHLAQGKTKRAWKTLEMASTAERALRYNEPPIYPRPVAEAWGQAAMRAGNRKMAEKVFRIALHELPESRIAVDGLRQLTSRRQDSAVSGGN
jgi:tetratricopeptide (TPR) repeat protein